MPSARVGRSPRGSRLRFSCWSAGRGTRWRATCVARDLGLTETAVRAWVKQADVDDGHREGLTSVQRAEFAQLRKENGVLREERDILERATAFFAFL